MRMWYDCKVDFLGALCVYLIIGWAIDKLLPYLGLLPVQGARKRRRVGF